MHFKSEPVPYARGELLKAARLNDDFGLDRFLLAQSSARFSDGILSGMVTRHDAEGFLVESGTFRINGQTGWLVEALRIEPPPLNSWRRLVLRPAKDPHSWQLAWEKDLTPQNALVLCRLKMRDSTVLKNFWTTTGEAPEHINHWGRHLGASDFIQMEYAMSASFGQKPSLLPIIQQALGKLAPQGELKLWLSNGLLPILDYYGEQDWGKALEALFSHLEGKKPDAPQKRHPVNLAG